MVPQLTTSRGSNGSSAGSANSVSSKTTFGSLLVDCKSATPYSDATKVGIAFFANQPTLRFSIGPRRSRWAKSRASQPSAQGVPFPASRVCSVSLSLSLSLARSVCVCVCVCVSVCVSSVTSVCRRACVTVCDGRNAVWLARFPCRSFFVGSFHVSRWKRPVRWKRATFVGVDWAPRFPKTRYSCAVPNPVAGYRVLPKLGNEPSPNAEEGEKTRSNCPVALPGLAKLGSVSRHQTRCSWPTRNLAPSLPNSVAFRATEFAHPTVVGNELV